MKGIREELSAMNDLPQFAVVTDKISNFLRALSRQHEEQKLVRFLNGLDETY